MTTQMSFVDNFKNCDIRLPENDLEAAIRQLRKKYQKEGVGKAIRLRESYPTKRGRKKAKARLAARRFRKNLAKAARAKQRRR